MIEKGSLVKLVNMEYDYGTGFDKSWKNGLVGTVIKLTKVTNINDGKSCEIGIVDLLVPFLSVGGGPVKWASGIDVRNMEEISRVSIITKPMNDGGK